MWLEKFSCTRSVNLWLLCVCAIGAWTARTKWTRNFQFTHTSPRWNSERWLLRLWKTLHNMCHYCPAYGVLTLFTDLSVNCNENLHSQQVWDWVEVTTLLNVKTQSCVREISCKRGRLYLEHKQECFHWAECHKISDGGDLADAVD